ncbi:hypothetical protein [Microbulbifer sp. VAAF005]|uniref:CarD family transcriptional regulator n=1 Tax=Microbulbifer sp. VAAF005 TaxID=3034230 RepID=UPI0024AD8527|nr:hypothetical protein [Microbulbifer sp. VAAF005]WHI45395.1 hypothetical protein P0078_16900 [Microbulbifer sp. VAAF005]
MLKKMDAVELESLEVNGIGFVTPGMKIVHPMFGAGEVESIFEFVESGENTIRINFDQHGSKALVPKYAKLSAPKPKNKKGSFLSSLFKRSN